MKFLRTMIVVASAWTFTQGAQADPMVAGAIVIQGMGTSSCAEFAQMYAANPETNELIYFSWAQGFMGGMNTSLLLAHLKPADFRKIPVDTQRQMIREFCDARPLEQYEQAVIALYKAMR